MKHFPLNLKSLKNPIFQIFTEILKSNIILIKALTPA